MNIGLWLERCGRSHPEAPAVGYGDDLVLRYGELAQRAARRAGALRGKAVTRLEQRYERAASRLLTDIKVIVADELVLVRDFRF